MKKHLVSSIILLVLIAQGCQLKEKKHPEISENDKIEKKEIKPQYDCESSLEDFQKVDAMVGTLYSLSPFEESAFDSIEILNGDIADELEILLSCAANQDFDNSGKLNELNYAQTEDGRIRNFSWYANNGGTWQMYNCVYQYFLDEKTAKTKSIEMSGGASKFYTLPGSENQYIGFSFTKSCSTCSGELAQLFSFKADTLHIENIIGFESRMGDLFKFDYDEKKETIYFSMIIDDLNDYVKDEYKVYTLKELNLSEEDLENIYIEGEELMAISDSLVWNGKKFIKK